MKILPGLYPLFLALLLFGCNSKARISDATGTFEADEVIVSAELPGRVIYFGIEEGQLLDSGKNVSLIDPLPFELQKQQVKATIGSLKEKMQNARPSLELIAEQRSILRTQLTNAYYERARTEKLIQADAATGKQLDDIDFQIALLKGQLAANAKQSAVQKNSTGTQNSTVMSEKAPLKRNEDLIEDQIRRTRIINPIHGTVLARYALKGEVTAAGKALYKIADLSVMTLRAYITQDQLSALRLGQKVTVLTDDQNGKTRTYKGRVSMISDLAEFTPKTIQTREERANLVYAIKVRVVNDGLLKVGMYGEVNFK